MIFIFTCNYQQSVRIAFVLATLFLIDFGSKAQGLFSNCICQVFEDYELKLVTIRDQFCIGYTIDMGRLLEFYD